MLRRSEFKRGENRLTSTTPMKRGTSTLARKPMAQARVTARPPEVDPVSGGAVKPPAKPRARLKTTRPKKTPIRSSARDEECTLRFHGVCNYRTDTTVLCHRNGAGAGMKSADTDACYGCFACHTMLDGHAPRPAWLTRDAMLATFEIAVGLTRARLATKGLLE